MAVLAMSVGCSKNDNSVVNGNNSESTIVDEVKVDQEEVIEITADDFKAFFEALYGYNEETLMALNENNDINYTGYIENLVMYKKSMKEGIGEFFTKSLAKQLETQQSKLQIDLPKKVFINGYVVNATGKIEKLEIDSIREIGDNKIYEIGVTSTNNVEPADEFYSQYSWSDERGYYIKGAGAVPSGVIAQETAQSNLFMYANQSNSKDKIKLVSRYWVEINEKEPVKDMKFAINGLTQSGSFEVATENKGELTNTQYIERIPYYDQVTDAQKKMMLNVFTKIMGQPRDVFSYYKEVSDSTFEYYKTFWSDLDLSEIIQVDEKTYKSAFATTINPYKDNIIEIKLNDKTVSAVPSIYSTQLQPTFIVTLPVKALLKNNAVVYYNYKYFVSTENNKVEAIQFIKMDKSSEAEYNGEVAAEPTSEDQTTVPAGDAAPTN